MNPPLGRWSYDDIIKIYKIFGKQLQEYEAVQRRIEIPLAIDINLTDDDNIFISRFWRDVLKLDTMIDLLDREIARRNNLIGVIG